MINTPMIQFLERFLNVTSDRQSLVVNCNAPSVPPKMHP
jgi:hypothetical protein